MHARTAGDAKLKYRLPCCMGYFGISIGFELIMTEEGSRIEHE